MFKVVLSFCLCVFAITLYAEQVQDKYVFETPAQHEQFYRVSSQLRCLVCQNQTLADSDSELANDLRTEILSQVKAGKSDQAIFDFVVARYGDFVLYNPPVKPITWVLWFGPMGLLLVCFVIWFLISTQTRRSAMKLQPKG